MTSRKMRMGRASRGHSVHGGAAFEAGKAAGARVDLGGSKIGGNGVKMIGR